MAKLPKRPKAPKASASFQTWKNYEQRLKDWQKKCTKIKSDKAAKAKLIQKLRNAR